MTRSLEEISAKQHLAILSLLAGDLQIEAAKKAKVHENELVKWMKDPLFLSALHEAEKEQLQTLTHSLVALASKACRELEKVLDNPQANDTHKVRASDVILGHLLTIRAQLTLEERIMKLEESMEMRDANKT
jgi:hypothetical protein